MMDTHTHTHTHMNIAFKSLQHYVTFLRNVCLYLHLSVEVLSFIAMKCRIAFRIHTDIFTRGMKHEK